MNGKACAMATPHRNIETMKSQASQAYILLQRHQMNASLRGASVVTLLPREHTWARSRSKPTKPFMSEWVWERPADPDLGIWQLIGSTW